MVSSVLVHVVLLADSGLPYETWGKRFLAAGIIYMRE